MCPRRLLFLVLFCLGIGIACGPAAAQNDTLSADQIVLLVNANVAASRQLAEFYAQARSIPANRILALDIPADDEIPFLRYERDVVLPVREFLRQNGLEKTTRCLLTFHGVPLRIAARVNTPAEQAELTELRLLLKKTTDGLTASGPATRPSRSDDEIRQIQKALAAAEQLSARQFDPQSRARLRSLVQENFGLPQYARLLQWQMEYLRTDRTSAALDNELALLWWNVYPRVGWVPNPLNCHYRGPIPRPVLMVMRLDAPQPGTVRDMIRASIAAESTGLRGTIAIDSRGQHEQNNVYAAFDEHLRDLASLVSHRTPLNLVFDEKPTVFPPNSLKDVAVYCGWYSVRNYVPAFTFAPGAVGYHIASFELTSLRGKNNREWCHGLLNDGVVATLGPVAEPYLAAFPRPDEFFPLLFTGKLPLAEVYWRTTPMTSWMICAIGDPLYNPFKSHPALNITQLPAPLKLIFQETNQVRRTNDER